MVCGLGKDNGMYIRLRKPHRVISITGHLFPCPLATTRTSKFLGSPELLLTKTLSDGLISKQLYLTFLPRGSASEN